MARIIFVDDDQVALKLVKTILQSAGHSVVTTADPRDAVDHLDRQSFDMLITDANMPGITGFDLVKTIRRQPQFKNLVIALLTGRREKKDIQTAVGLGANGYIVKPIDPTVLISKVGELLKSRTPEGAAKAAGLEGTGDTKDQKVPTAHMKYAASFEVELVVTALSEKEIVFKSPFAFPTDKKMKLKSSLFSVIGIEPPLLRISSFSKDPSDDTFTVHAVFITLAEGDSKKITAWIQTLVARTVQAS